MQDFLSFQVQHFTNIVITKVLTHNQNNIGQHT